MADAVKKVIYPSGQEEHHITRNIVMVLMLIIILYVVSVFFYHKFEGWNYLDATYFVTMTITTIGYGDLVPKTVEGKLFTIFLAFIGISLAFLLIANIGGFREKTIDRHVADRLSLLRKISVLQRPPPQEKKRGKKEEFTKIPGSE